MSAATGELHWKGELPARVLALVVVLAWVGLQALGIELLLLRLLDPGLAGTMLCALIPPTSVGYVVARLTR